MKSYSPLLKNALNSIDNYRLNEYGYLHGTDVVDVINRSLWASCFYYDIDRADERFEKGDTHKLILAPEDCPAEKFIELNESEAIPANESISLRYGMVETEDEVGIRWDKAYSAEFSEVGFTESISSSLIIYSLDNEPCGFFSFGISLVRSSDTAFFSVDLPLVYVRPSYRKGTYGLDLTFMLAYYLSKLFEKVFQSYRGKSEMDVVITSSLESKGGERIANYILDEMEVTIDFLKDRFPVKAHKLGALVREVGY